MSEPALVVTRAGDAAGSRELAAAVACVRSGPDQAALLVDLDGARRVRPTPIASAAARALEERLGAHLPEAEVASRGSTCHLLLPEDRLDRVGAALALARETGGVLHVPPGLFGEVLSLPGIDPKGLLLRVDLGDARALAALVGRDARQRRIPFAVQKQAPGWLAGRCALAGLGARLAAPVLSPACARLVVGPHGH